MNTMLLSKSEYHKLYEFLDDGRVVGFPTETVYGLAFRFDSQKGLDELGKLKNRPITKPITMMLSNGNDINKYAFVSTNAKRVIDRYMPGSITIILKAKDNIPQVTSFNLHTIGIRIPSSSLALDILRGYSVPLLVTSANVAGEKAESLASIVYNLFNNRLVAMINEDASSDLASTIVDMSEDDIKLIREGKISFSEIKKVWEGKL